MNAPGGFGMSDGDVEALRRAKDTLEHAGLAARIAALLGMPIEEAMKRLPSKWSGRINRITESSLMAALKTALVTVEDRQRQMHGLAAVMRDVTSRFEEIRGLKQKLAEATAPPSPH